MTPIPRVAKLPPNGKLKRSLARLVTLIITDHMRHGRAEDIYLAVYCSGVTHGALLATREKEVQP